MAGVWRSGARRKVWPCAPTGFASLGQAIAPDELMNMVQVWKMLHGQAPVRKRYQQKQVSILTRSRIALSEGGVKVERRGWQKRGPPWEPEPCRGRRRARRRRQGRPWDTAIVRECRGGALVEPLAWLDSSFSAFARSARQAMDGIP